MNGFPQEVLVVLVGLALLVKFLYERWRRRVALARAEPVPDALAVSQPSASRRDAEPAPAPRVIEELAAASRTRAPPTSPRASSRPRRFSRRALFPSRRALQNAVVVATVLRPCHAHRPHDIDMAS